MRTQKPKPMLLIHENRKIFKKYAKKLERHKTSSSLIYFLQHFLIILIDEISFIREIIFGVKSFYEARKSIRRQRNKLDGR